MSEELPKTGEQVGDGHRQRVTVIGAGYVGLITAVGLAERGHTIELIETRSDRLEAVRKGVVPIHEPGVEERLKAHLATRRLQVHEAPVENADVLMICVATPIDSTGRSDLRQLRHALDSVRQAAGGGAALVVRSTVPPGSSRLVSEWSEVPTSRVLFNPEFLRQGSALRDFEQPTRIVVAHFPDVAPGLIDRVLSLYDGLSAPRLIVDVASGELIKNGANAFLALKLSFANEIASLCEEFGADVDAVLHGVGLDPRIGGSYLRPSYGFGGSCLPKELAALTVAGTDKGLPMHMASAASSANRASQQRFVARITSELGELDGRRIAMLGLAFKAGTDDVRDSPALAVARALLDAGATVTGTDPVASANAVGVEPRLMISTDAENAVRDADAVLITTEWTEFAELDWPRIRELVRTPIIFDGRRLLDAQQMVDLGFRYFAVGSGAVHAAAVSPFAKGRAAPPVHEGRATRL